MKRNSWDGQMVPGLPTHFIAIFLLLTIITAEKELNLTKKER
jgi:hypothetical protein